MAPMHLSRKAMIVGGSVVALAAGGAGTAIATSNDGEGGATGPGADQATAAALKITHGGHANSVERVDVRLDQNYQLVVVEGDSENSGDTGN
jgi:hypothetical protein